MIMHHQPVVPQESCTDIMSHPEDSVHAHGKELTLNPSPYPSAKPYPHVMAWPGMALQAGVGAFTGVEQEVEDVRSQMTALECEVGGLAEQVGPAVAALQAANPPYQLPPHDDKVTMAVYNICLPSGSGSC